MRLLFGRDRTALAGILGRLIYIASPTCSGQDTLFLGGFGNSNFIAVIRQLSTHTGITNLSADLHPEALVR